jgi:hypothetical protein
VWCAGEACCVHVQLRLHGGGVALSEEGRERGSGGFRDSLLLRESEGDPNSTHTVVTNKINAQNILLDILDCVSYSNSKDSSELTGQVYSYEALQGGGVPL